MRPQRPLALLLSLLIAGQPALLQAASLGKSEPRNHPQQSAALPGRERSPNLRPVFTLLTAGGHRDKTAEREMEDLIGSIAESLSPEAIEELASMVAVLAGNPGDPAALEEAMQMFTQTMDAQPNGTRDEIQRFVAAGTSMAGLSYALHALLMFKAHKDNPQQPTIGTPISLVLIAAALLFLPSILGVAEGSPFSDCSHACSDPCAAQEEVESSRAAPASPRDLGHGEGALASTPLRP